MKYMLLMQFNAQVDFPPLTTWTPEEVGAHIRFMREDAHKKIAEVGELVAAQGLAGPEQARIVRAGSDGAPQITDGPFPESKEFLAGYWVIDVKSPEQAYEVAAFVSAAPGPGGRPLNMPIHVQPVMSAPEA